MELDETWGFVQRKANRLWLWLAVCRRTRQVVAYTLGDRGEDSARWLKASIPAGYRRRATRSDHWEAYRKVFAPRTHRLCGKQEGQTCRVENLNGVLRQRLGRLVRRTLSFSKCERAHELVIRWFLTEHNLRLLPSTHA